MPTLTVGRTDSAVFDLTGFGGAPSERAGVAARVRTGLPHQPTSVRGPHPVCPTSRASPCSSPALSTCSGRRWALPRSSCWRQAGCTVEVPAGQTCCGQPAFNSGDRATTEALARGLIDEFAGYDYVVAPSGSCAGMLRTHLPELFDDEPADEAARRRAGRAVPRAGELPGRRQGRPRGQGRARGHAPPTTTAAPACASCGSSGSRATLLASVAGLELVEMEESEVCCGFGGTFCVKYPEISTRMVSEQGRQHRGHGRRSRCSRAISAA